MRRSGRLISILVVADGSNELLLSPPKRLHSLQRFGRREPLTLRSARGDDRALSFLVHSQLSRYDTLRRLLTKRFPSLHQQRSQLPLQLRRLRPMGEIRELARVGDVVVQLCLRRLAFVFGVTVALGDD